MSDAKNKKITEHLSDLLKEERLHFKSGYYSQYHLRWFDYMYNEKGPTHPYYIKRTSEYQTKQKMQGMLQKTKGPARRYIENTMELL